ncbi:MAG: DUF2157 domain-containing protein [Flavobacteriales bacterium]|jgi:hypothetical protein|nr:DUF2157 domain-containing protein [Flavobacteriales bacterium]
MRDPRLSEALPELLHEGVLEPEQAERIRRHYGLDGARSGSAMLLVLSIIGSVLVGLGIILIVAHNWDDLPRAARTALAFVPVLLGLSLVAVSLFRNAENVAWREGSALLLASGIMASVALISQIYHIHGELQGYLLFCSVLILPLLYLPGSIVVTLGFLAMVLWQGVSVRTEHWGGDAFPWAMLGLLAASVPAYLTHARSHGQSIGFWWHSLFMAIGTGVGANLFYSDWELAHVTVLLAMGSAYTLVPWLFPDPKLHTWPWALVGGATVLIILFGFSFRPVWEELLRADQQGFKKDVLPLSLLAVAVLTVFVLAHRRRTLFERWPYPEGLGLFLICLGVSLASPAWAAILVNLSLLAVGVVTIRLGITTRSLKRMNLGLAVVSLTILMRFFDTDLSFVLRGLVFIAVGLGFLYMNLRMLREQKRDGQAG